MKKIIALILALIFILAFSACSNEAANTEPTEEDLALYEEILFNFGGTYRHDGSLIVSRKGSLYDLREGIVFRSKDGSKSFKAVSNEYLLKYHQ